MAHRRAVARSGAWRVWLLVPLALGLDLATALALEGRARPFGVTIPEGMLLAAPLLVYVTLALLMLRTWSVAWRLVAAAVLLGLHAGLVAMHVVLFMSLWSLPVSAALRHAHRWSPLVPLLQLVWVPMLALPLVTLGDRRPVASRPIPRRVPVEVLLHRASRLPAPKRAEPDRSFHVGTPGAEAAAPPAPAGPVTAASSPSEASAVPPDTDIQIVAEASQAAVEVPPSPPAPPPAPVSMAPLAPTWLDELLEPAARSDASTLPGPEPVVAATVDAMSAAPASAPLGEPRARALLALPADSVSSRDEPASLVRLHDIATAPVALMASRLEPEPLQLPEAIPPTLTPLAAAPVADLGSLAAAVEAVEPDEVAAPDTPQVVAAPRILEPPVDLDLVARVFAPYSPLLSRDREVGVDWIPAHDAAVVCVAPRELSRDRMVGLAARLAPVLAAPVQPVLGSIRRLSLRGPAGAVVLTPLGGAVLAAAARRLGATALLETLSARVVTGSAPPDASRPPGDTAGAAEIASSRPIRVETGAATLLVYAPDLATTAAVGELTGQLLAVIQGGSFVLDSLSVDFGHRRLMVRPVGALATPARFVAVIGGAEHPGLLARGVERAAQTLREAS